MKRTAIISLILLFGLSACGNDTQTSPTETPTKKEQTKSHKDVVKKVDPRKVETKVENINTQLNELESDIDNISSKSEDIKKRVDKLIDEL